jgi:hypothetical protein
VCVRVCLCGFVYALVYPIAMGRSSCCILCVCMWFRLCAGVSHSDGSFFLLCVFVYGPVYALVYRIVMGRSSCCVVYVVPYIC